MKATRRYIVKYMQYGEAHEWRCYAYDEEDALDQFEYTLDEFDVVRFLGVDRPRNGWGKVDTSKDRAA